jgi:predicted outer membrane repeat protein
MGSALCVSIGSNLKLHDSVFKSNNAYLSTVIVISYGESRYQLSTLYVRGCLFENNTSRTNTAIYLDELGKCEILDSKFRNNVATFSGGIVTFDASIQAIVKNCLFESNNAVKGGAIYMHPFNGSPSNVLIRDCVFSKNHASISGGAIYANAANLEIVNTNFNRNSASDNGGAIFTYNGATKIASSYFNGNSAQFGGAANLLSNSIAVSGSVFNNNAASKKGGGVYSKTIQVSSSNCRYINNRAPVAGTVYGAFKVTVKQTCKYFGGVKLSIKLSSPWKVSLAQKIKLKFTRGAKTYKTGWIKTSARGVLNLKVPVDLKCGKYSLTVSAQSGVCYINPITITVIKAPVKITAKKITAKYNSGKLFKIHVKNAKTKKGVNGAKVKLKVYMGKSHYTVTLKANQKGVVKYDTSNMYLGSHIIKMSAADKNIKLSKKAKSKIMITKGTCKVAAPKKIRKHTNLKVRILKKISKEPIKKTKFYVNVDYKTYKLKTDSKGVLKIKTKKLAKGKHELLIILNNDRYDINKKLSFKIR